MNISSTEAIVHLVRDKVSTVEDTNLIERDRRLVVKPLNDSYEISFNSDTLNIERKVLVDGYCEKEMSSVWAQQEKAIDQVLDGYDVCMLYLSNGTNAKAIHQNRLNNQELILRTLQSKINHPENKIKLYYAHIGLSDNNYFDMRRDTTYTNERMLERGIGSLTRRVEDVGLIWFHMERTSAETTFMLNIRVSDEAKKNEGSLLLVDLAHPVFTFNSLAIDEAEEFRYSSVNLYNTVCKIDNDDVTIDTEGVVPYLTKEMLPYVLGYKKLIMCGYFQECIESQVSFNKMKLCLNFIHNLRGTRTYMIRNLLKMDTNSRLIRDLQNENSNVILAYKQLEKEIKTEQSKKSRLIEHIQYNKEIIQQIHATLNEVRKKMEEKERIIKIREEELEDLKTKNEKLRIALAKDRHLILTIKRAVEEVKKFRNEHKV